MTPKASVIMGVYKSDDKEELERAIQSIREQTEEQWEFVICDDGSPDDTFEYLIQHYGDDPRFIIIQNPRNMGLAAALNHCLENSSGEFVMRQDSDDYSDPRRMEKQLRYMQEHPKCDVVGTAMVIFNESGQIGVRTPIERITRKSFLNGTVVAHATTMMRKQALLDVGGYHVESYTYGCEDYDLFMRMFAEGKIIANMSDKLYYVQEDARAYCRKNFRRRWNEARVRLIGFSALKEPIWGYLFVLKPIILGILPVRVLRYLQEKKIENNARIIN